MADRNLELALKIKALVEGVDKIKGIAGDVQKLQGQSAKPLGDPTKPLQDGVRKSSDQIQQLKRLLGTAFAFVGLSHGLSQLARMTDAYKQFNAQVKLGIGVQGDMATAQSEVRRIANDNMVALEAIGELYGRLAGPVLRLGKAQEEVSKVTEAVALGLRISGATAEESASAVLQFSQSLASGVLRGEEFNAVNEAAPRLMLALAESMGVPREALRGMAEDGQLTAELVATALPKALDKLRSEAASLPSTVGGSFQVLRNRMLEAVGEADKAAGVSDKIGRVIKGVADNMAALAAVITGLLTAAFTGLAAVAAGSVGSIAARLASLLGLIGGPVGLIVSLGLAAVAWISFRKSATGELDAVIAKQRELNALTGKGFTAQQAADPRRTELATLTQQLAQKRKELADAEKVTATRIAQDSLGGKIRFEPINQSQRIRLREEIKLAEQAVARLQTAADKSDADDAKREAEIKRLLEEAKKNAKKDKEDKTKALSLPQLQRDTQAYYIEQAALLENDKAANERAFEAKLITAQAYYAKLRELAEAEAALELGQLAQQKQALAGQLGQLSALRVTSPDDRKARDEALSATRVQLADVEARITARQIQLAGQLNAVRDQETARRAEALTSAQALVDALSQETFLLELSDAEREKAVKLLELEALQADLTAEAYAKLRDRLNTALDAKAAAEARKKALEDAKQQADEIYSALTENLQRGIADVLNNAFTGGGARDAVKSFVDFLRTSLSNVLAAQLTQGVLSLFPKDSLLAAGGFLGLGKKGETPANPVFVKDVSLGNMAAAGGTGGAFGGFFESIQGFFSRFASGISSFFSSLASSLSGLFSGGGGGIFSAIGSLFGFAEGGYTGPGGKYQPAGVVHAGEYVFSQAAVRNIGLPALNLLHRLAGGIAAPRMPRVSYADGGLVNLPGAAAPVVNSSTRVVNLFDPSQVAGELGKTREFERAVLNIIQLNPRALQGAF